MEYKIEITFWEPFREFMGWHNPVGISGFDGCSFQSKCKLCGKNSLWIVKEIGSDINECWYFD